MSLVSVDLTAVSERLKALRARLALYQYEAAAELGVRPRTFQGWENGEVLTSRENYEMLAAFYSNRLAIELTANDILFGPGGAPIELNGAEQELRAGIERLGERIGKLEEQLHELQQQPSNV